MNTQTKSNVSSRMNYFDSLRLIAMIIIFVTHFIGDFHTAYFSLWREFPTVILLKGVSGKLAVALFGILLGYFAFLTKDKSFTHYVIKRYAFFAISGFIINLLFAIAGNFSSAFTEYSFINVMEATIKLSDKIFEPYWCMAPFFIASVISYLNNKANISGLGIALEMFMFMLISNVWVSVCLMGNLVAKYQDHRFLNFLNHKMVRIVLWCVIFILIKTPTFNVNIAYLLKGVCCSVMLLIIMRGHVVKKILNNSFMACIGKKGMGILILHTLLYSFLGPILFDCFAQMPYACAFCLTMLICFAVVVLLSFPLMWFVNKLTNIIGDVTNKIENLCLKKQ